MGDDLIMPTEHIPDRLPDDNFEKKMKEFRVIWRLARDIILFFGGLGGIIYETIGAHAVNQPLLVIFAGMMGLPAFLRVDKY